MQNMLLDALDSIGKPRILVLGDLIFDRYTWGEVGRISPEAPVPVLRAEKREARLGGAASVASLLAALEADVALAGVLGIDPEARSVGKLLAEAQIDAALVFSDPGRPTTVKERFLGRVENRQPQQLLRIDHEIQHPLGQLIEERLAEGILAWLPDFQAVLISDYAKGVCTPRLLQQVTHAAHRHGIPVIVDPARITNYERYRDATVITPNRVEAELATGRNIRNSQDALQAGAALCEQCDCGTVVVTLDSDGMALVERGREGRVIPTRRRTPCDVTGAGDMALAVIGLSLAASLEIGDAAGLANCAAGLEVEQFGVTPVTRNELRDELAAGQRAARNKLVTLDEMSELAESCRRRGQTLVFTNGCFDLLHAGHVTCLEEAAEQADVLIVAINGDQTLRRLKGPHRPVIRAADRAKLLAALGCVDHVLIYDEETPHAVLRRLRPDVLVKGGSTEVVVGREVVEAYGGRVYVTSRVEDVSTTRIIAGLTNGRNDAQRALKSQCEDIQERSQDALYAV